MQVSGNITGNIFDFNQLVKKFAREIERLKEAEERGNEVDAMDFALNAALTGFHLLEWESQEHQPGVKIKARELLMKKNHPSLDLLHDIVSRVKHVTVSNSAVGGNEINVRTSGLATETAQSFGHVKIDSVRNYSLESVVIKFHNRRALDVLEEVLSIFS